MPRHRSSAVPLAWLYTALIVYASLYPFIGWRVPGVGAARLPAARLAALVDLVRPRLQPARLHPARRPAVRRDRAQRRRAGPARGGSRARRHGAVALDGDAAELPAAARSPRTSTSASTRSAPLLGAALGLLVHWRGGIERWQRTRDRWFVSRSAGGLALLVLWPIGLLFPTAVPFGLGQVLGRLQQCVADSLQGTPAAAVDRRLGRRRDATTGASRSRRRRVLAHRTRPAGAVHGRVHDRAARLARAGAGARGGAASAAYHDAVDRAQLRPEHVLAWTHAAGDRTRSRRRSRPRRC